MEESGITLRRKEESRIKGRAQKLGDARIATPWEERESRREIRLGGALEG